MNLTLGLVAAMRSRRLLVSAVFVLLALGAVAGAYLTRPAYESHAKIMLNLGSRPISLSRAEAPAPAVAIQTVEALTTLSEVFSSRDLVEQLVDELGPDAFEGQPPASPLVRWISDSVSRGRAAIGDMLVRAHLVPSTTPRESLIADVEKMLSIHPVRQSQVIEIGFRWFTPSVPPLVLQRLLSIYVDRVNEMNAQTAEHTVLSGQAEKARLALDTAHGSLSALRAETGIVDPAVEREALSERIERLSPLLGNGETGEPAGVVLGGESGPGAEIAALRRQLNELRIERSGALSRYTADSPVVQGIDAQIAAAGEALESERARISAALAADRARLARVLSAEPRFADAQRNVDLASEAYRTYRQAANDRHVMRLADEELRLKIIDVPAATAQSSGPSRLALLLVGLFGAAVIACLFGLFVERLATSTETESEDESDPQSRTVQTARLVRDADETPAAPALRATTVKR